MTKRNIVVERIKNLVDESTEGWGIDVLSVELKDIKVPEYKNTIVFAVPLEVLRAVEGLGKKLSESKKSEQTTPKLLTQ